MPASAPLIHHSRPTTGPEEAAAVADVLASGHHARGPVSSQMEGKLAATVALSHAHATTSGSAAIELVLRALGASSGRSVVIPTLTCAAIWNAVRNTGAEAIFHDGDYRLTTAADLAQHVRADTCAVVLVSAVDSAPDLQAAGYRPGPDGTAEVEGAPVILDRCQQLAPQPTTTLRALAEVFSFYATKCISTGMGGAIATSDPSLHARVIDLNNPDGCEDYSYARFKFQFDDIRAAVGLVQLGRLAGFVRRRHELAAAYHDALRDSRVRVKAPDPAGMTFRLLADCGTEAACDSLKCHLASARIEAKRPVFRPLHRYAGLPDRQFPQASDAWGRNLSLPIYPSLTDADLARVVTAVVEWEAAEPDPVCAEEHSQSHRC